MEIRHDAKAFERFKRIARAKHPVEYLEILVGKVTPEAIEILKSYPISHTASLSTEGDAGCEYDSDLLEPIRLRAEKAGLEIVGSVHSHPDGAPVPSETDNDDARGEKVFGIYSFTKNKSSGRCSNAKLCFYLPQLPVKTTPTRRTNETTPAPPAAPAVAG